MKICFLIEELIPGSAPKLISYPAQELIKLGHKVCLLIILKRGTKEENKIIKDFLTKKKIEVRFISNKIPKFLLKLNFKFPFMDFFSLHHILALFFAHRLIKFKEFDYIISHCQYTFFGNLNLKIFRKISHSLIVWDPSDWTINKKKLPISIFYLLKIFCFLLDFISCKLANSLIISCKFHKKKFLSFNKNIDYLYPCSQSFNLKNTKKDKTILVFDRWDSGNNPLKYLDIIEILHNKNAKFILNIGGTWHDKTMKDKFFNYVKEKKLSKFVNYLGYLSDKEINILASKSKYHLNLVHEAFGMPSLEVAKQGCLPFVVQNSGILDILKLPKELIIKDNESAKKLSYKILIMENNNKKYSSFSKKIIKQTLKYDWKYYALTLEKILKKNFHLQKLI